MAPLSNAQFVGNKSMLKGDLVNKGIIVDQSDYSKYYDDMLDHICNFITAHVKSVVSSNGDDCQLKMDKVVLKNICKTCFLVLETAKHFNTANSAYHSAESKCHDDINDSECFIVYLDISKLYPSRTEYIDALDWTKIYLSIQPQPTVPAATTAPPGVTQQTDVDHLVVLRAIPVFNKIAIDDHLIS